MHVSPIVAHTIHYKRPTNQSYVYYSPPKQQFSSWDDNTTLRDLLIAALLLLGINSSESAWNNRTPEFSLGETEYVGPKQPWWKHLWNGAKGTVIGGTQSE